MHNSIKIFSALLVLMVYNGASSGLAKAEGVGAFDFCDTDPKTFYEHCEPTFSFENGECTTDVRLRESCYSLMENMDLTCKPCCERWGANGKGQNATADCIEEQKRSSVVCGPKAQRTACLVPIAGEQTPSVIVMCNTLEPEDICVKYMANGSGYQCKSCCYYSATDMPTCNDVTF